MKNEPEIKESASPVTQNSPSKSTQSESQSTPNTQQAKTPEQGPAKKNLVGIKEQATTQNTQDTPAQHDKQPNATPSTQAAK